MAIRPHWYKVVNDLIDNKVRTLLVIAAIAIGVASFGGVLMSRQIMLNDIQQSYQATRPANVTMYVTPFDRQVVNTVAKYPETVDAIGEATVQVKLMRPNDTEENLDLYVYDEYDEMQVNIITPESGPWPPPLRQIILERTSMDYLGLEIGDEVTVKTPDDVEYRLTIGGSAHDLNIYPATVWPDMTGYISQETIRYLGQSGKFGVLKIITAPEYDTLPEIEVAAYRIKKRLERNKGSIYVLTYETSLPEIHWAKDMIAGFTKFLSGMGLAALGLSAFLVVNTISAVLSQQKRQIGVMKAIGMTSANVAKIYFGVVLAYGLLALTISLPLGAWLGYLCTRAAFSYLNFDIQRFYYPAPVLFAMIGAALLTPLIAALVPIVNATRVTVREAINDYGIKDSAQPGPIARMLTRMRSLPRPVMLSLRNAFRKRGRLLLTVGILTAAGAIFISVLSVRSALEVELNRALLMSKFDVLTFTGGWWESNTLERVAMHVEGVVAAEGWNYAKAVPIRADGSQGDSFTVLGVPYDTPFVDPGSQLIAGRWLNQEDTNALVVSSEWLRDERSFQVGDEVTLEISDMHIKKKWIIVGVYRSLDDTDAYASFDHLSRVMRASGLARALLVETNEHTQSVQNTVVVDLNERLNRAGINAEEFITRTKIIKQKEANIGFLIHFMLAIALFVALIGGIGLTGTLSLNAMERIREFGVMRSIGASNRTIALIVMTEGGSIGLLGWLISVLVALPTSWGLITLLGEALFERPMYFSYSLEGALLWLPIALLIAMLAGIVPAWYAVNISIREALSYE